MEKSTAMRYAPQTKIKQSKKQHKQDVNNNWRRGGREENEN